MSHCFRLEGSAPATAALGWATALPSGTQVFVVGYPAPLDESAPTVTQGIISGVRDLEGIAYLQLDAAANPGNSGGPVVTASGELAGLIVGRIRDAVGLNFALPANTLRAYLGHPLARGRAEQHASPSPATTELPKTQGQRDMIDFFNSWCSQGIVALLTRVVREIPRTGKTVGEVQRALDAQNAYLNALARTPRNVTVGALRTQLLQLEQRIRDLLTNKLYLIGNDLVVASIDREIGGLYDQRSFLLQQLDGLYLGHGVVIAELVPPGGCTQ